MSETPFAQSVPTRAMASLIAEIEPEALSNLSGRFPRCSGLFSTEYKLGRPGSQQGAQDFSEEANAGLFALIEKTFQLSEPSLERLIGALTLRGRHARRARLVGSIAAALCSASGVVSIAASKSNIALAVSTVAVVGSMCVIVGEYLEKSFTLNQKSLGEFLADAMAANAQLAELRLALVTIKSGDRQALIEIAKKTNAVAAKIKEISVFGNITLSKPGVKEGMGTA